MPFLRFAGFTVVRAWQGFWRNAVMSLAATATVILMLVLLAALLIVLAGLDSGLRFIESKVEVTAELRDHIDRPSRERLIERIEAMPEVTGVEYVSPDEAFRRLREATRAQGRELDTGGARIQLQATIEVSLSDPRYAAVVTRALEAERGAVEKVITKQDTVDTLVGVVNVVRTIGVVAIVLVALTVLFMIVNTIRIAVYSRANEIEIMRLVGASDSFIRWPFILEGILCGLIGAVVTVVLVAVAWEPIQPVMVSMFQMPQAVSTRFLATLSVLLFAAGLGVGAIGSWISVRSYLSAAR
jgi:cell division transport system permease protein